MAKEKQRKIGRNAIDGTFITIEEARRNPKTTVIETIKVPTKKPNKG